MFHFEEEEEMECPKILPSDTLLGLLKYLFSQKNISGGEPEHPDISLNHIKTPIPQYYPHNNKLINLDQNRIKVVRPPYFCSRVLRMPTYV